MKRGDTIVWLKCRPKPDGTPDFAEWICWQELEHHVDITPPEQYRKYLNKELGTCVINGVTHDEIPYHVGILKKDVIEVKP